MATFLDAVRILAGTPQLPYFNVWIIGGSESEVTAITTLLSTDRVLSELLATGRIALWGRVDHAGMATLLARSMAVVVPSLREQYGIVAVEAMMCGTPVVASRTGGLVDLVLPDITGHLFDRDDAALLSAILMLYLRAPALVARLRRNARAWAETAFVQSEWMHEYPRAYDGEPPRRIAWISPEGVRLPDGSALLPIDAREIICGTSDDVIAELQRLRDAIESRSWPVPLHAATRFVRFCELVCATLHFEPAADAAQAARAIGSVHTFAEGVQRLGNILDELTLPAAAAWLAVHAMNDAFAELCTGSRVRMARVTDLLHDAFSVWSTRFTR